MCYLIAAIVAEHSRKARIPQIVSTICAQIS
jgi:hypothetical protein